MRTLQEKYNAVLEGNFSKTQFRRDAAMELPQFVSSVNSFDDTVTILKNKGIVTEAFGDEHQFGDTTYGDNQGLEVKSLAKQLYLGFKKMGARVRLDANRKKSPIGAEWGKDGLDQIDVLIWVGDSHKGYMVTIDLIGDKAMSFADKIMNDPKFSKFEFSKREIKTWGGQKGTELEVKPKVSKKGGVSVTEAKNQEPKYSTAKPADTIAPDVLDTGIKFELDKKYGTLDVTPEQYGKAKEAAVKNLAKDVLYYVKQDSIQLDTPGEKMEKAKIVKEEISKEEAWKKFQEERHVTDKTIKVAREDFEKEWEAGKLKEGFLDRFKKKPAQSEPAPAKVLSADEIQAMIDQEAKTNTVGDILNAATVLGTIDLRNATPEQVKMFVSIARDSDYGHDTITGDNYIDYLESLPNYKGVAEVKVQVNIPGQKPRFAEDDKEYANDDEADEFIKRAKEHEATPMGTTFKKVNETVDTDELRARIANILKGQLTSLRKIGGDAIIEDYIETQIQAYLDGDVDIEEPMEVVNDFRYYMDDNSRAAADFNSSLSPNNSTPETLEEGEVVDLPMTAAGYSRGETYDTEKYGKVKIIDQLDGDDIPAAYGRFRVEKINEDDEESPEDYANANAGSPMHAPPGLEEDKDKPSFYDYPENKHLDDRDPEEKRKALKEMFKKIIVNLINE